ncbi:MAG: hypothetical protein ACOC9Y_01170 [Chloroflexota bacterium]
MEEGGVELAAQQEAALLVPPEGRPVVAAVLRERLEVPGGVAEFKRTILNPSSIASI